MIPVTLTQGVTDGMADQPPNHTLEDVAEEILNGMFCTYEPPPTTRSKPKKRGILRAPKVFRRNRSDQSSNKSVRWSDTHDQEEETDKEEVHPHLDFHCNITGACLDAGIEAGCFSPSHKTEKEEQHNKKSTKSGAPKKLTEEIVFDEQGNPKSLLSGRIVDSPPPPPPQVKEDFVPHLCGVRMNCGDDVDHPEDSAKSSREGPNKTYHRPKQQYDYDDDQDNSLVDEEDDEDSAAMEERHKQQHQAILKRRMKKLREKQEKQRRKKVNQVEQSTQNETDWDEERASTVSGNSSFFRRVFYKKGVGREDALTTGRESNMSRSASPVCQNRKSVSFDDEDGELDPVHVVGTGHGKVKRVSKKLSANDDWDESVPIIPNRSQTMAMRRTGSQDLVTQNYRQQEIPITTARVNSSRPARDLKSRDPSPGLTRTRSRSVDDKDEGRSSRWSLPTRSGSKNSRSKSPSRARSISPNRRTGLSGQEQVRVTVLKGRRDSLTNKAMENFNHMHPPHPRTGKFDDALERDSMITAHRRGIDSAVPSFAETDSEMDRQSFITAHRQGFVDEVYNAQPSVLNQKVLNGTLHPMSLQGYRSYDDMLERQSFITASRQDFDDVPQTRACGMMEMKSNARLKPEPVFIADPMVGMRGQPNQSTANQASQSKHNGFLDEAATRARIRQTLENLPDQGSMDQPPRNIAPQYFSPQTVPTVKQDEGSCCMQYCLPGVIPQPNPTIAGNPGQLNHPFVRQEPVIDRKQQAQQQAQLQRQYYNRVRLEQNYRSSPGKSSQRVPARRQKTSRSFSFFRRTRSRSPASSRSRSKSPSKNMHQPRARSLDRTESRVPLQPRHAVTPAHQQAHMGYPQYQNQLLMNQQQLLYQQQLAIQNQMMQQEQANQRVKEAVETEVASEPPKREESESKELTWEERTKQAWERLRSGLTFESAEQEKSSEADSQSKEKDEQLKTGQVKSESKAYAVSDNEGQKEQPSFLQSALAMLTSTPAKEESTAEELSSKGVEQPSQPLMQMPTQSNNPSAPPQLYPMQMIHPNQMALYAQQQQWIQRQLQLPLQAAPYQMQLPLQTQMVAPAIPAYQKPSGILKQSSFDNRRVTFGERTEQTFIDEHDENLSSPGRRKVFKGKKIISGLFGRASVDPNKQSPSREQSPGLELNHTRSTDLSSCPSTYTLSEEWDGGPYLYSAGPVSPHAQSAIEANGVLDTLSHLKSQVNRNRAGPQDPSGPIAV